MSDGIYPQETGLGCALRFLRGKSWIVVLVSALLVVPCFWHRHIEAGDLGSHVYNAWLAQLIQKGQAPGLYIARQWNNTLFDLMLLKLGNLMGLDVGEKIGVALCVLIFFWGVFALLAAATQRAPWYLTPCIAMLAYGYTFNMGFINYYLSVGLACFSLALFWRARGLDWLVATALVPLAWLAHPLGFLWLACALIYLRAWNRLGPWSRLVLSVAAVACVFAVRWHVMYGRNYEADWLPDPFYLFNGADQLALYGPRYVPLEWAALTFGVLCFAVDVFSRGRELSYWRMFRLLLELYLVSLCVTALLPENLRPSPGAAWVGLLVSRLTTISAIFGLCVMSYLKPRRWHLAGFAACAAVFFVFLYQDTAGLNRLEARAENLTRNLPFGTRVLATIFASPDSRMEFIGHVVDRACIGHCFSYGNYEPSSKQFRVRVLPGSPVVTFFADDTEEMGAGVYEVQEEDLPLKEIYQCAPHDLTELCIRDLAAGEKNGRMGYRPPAN